MTAAHERVNELERKLALARANAAKEDLAQIDAQVRIAQEAEREDFLAGKRREQERMASQKEVLDYAGKVIAEAKAFEREVQHRQVLADIADVDKKIADKLTNLRWRRATGLPMSDAEC